MRSVCYACLALFLGCQQPYRGTLLQLEMVAPQQAVLIKVENEKTVSYGGGINAVEGKTTWSGELGEEQQKKYMSLVDDTTWATASQRNDDSVGSGHYKIRIRTNNYVTKKFTLSLTDKKATSLYEFLMKVADSRFEKHIESLPKPNMDVIIDRKLNQE